MNIDPSGTDYFQRVRLPEGTELIGWAALVDTFGVQAPVRHPSVVSNRHVNGSQRVEGLWHVFDKRYRADGKVSSHLEFALRHEVVDLLVIKRVLEAIPQDVLLAYIRSAPTGTNTRRAWFFYEELIGPLPIEDAPRATTADALNPERYFTTDGPISTRHRVRNNLLGVKGFHPIVRRTERLREYEARDLSARTAAIVGQAGAHYISRAASFLLLSDSQASFAIEGENPPHKRIKRWGEAILEAGRKPLSRDEVYRLHGILIADDRFIRIGYRDDGVFLGHRDHFHDPVPEFIGARPDQIEELMDGLYLCNHHLRIHGVDPVVQAAIIAFGFVYIHPLTDGNGRLHRCLIHSVLSDRNFSPRGMVFPVSSVMLERIVEYRDTLQAHSKPLMDAIEWTPTPDHNVEVTNDTSDLYAYFDATEEAEFLYSCVARTVDVDLPREIDYLKRYDVAVREINDLIEMPDRMVSNLILYIRQNDGKLSKGKRKREFDQMTDEEVEVIEQIVNDAFDGYEG